MLFVDIFVAFSFVGLGNLSTCLMTLDEEEREKGEQEKRRKKERKGRKRISRPTLFSSSEQKSLTRSNSARFSTCIPPFLNVLITAICDVVFARRASDSGT